MQKSTNSLLSSKYEVVSNKNSIFASMQSKDGAKGNNQIDLYLPGTQIKVNSKQQQMTRQLQIEHLFPQSKTPDGIAVKRPAPCKKAECATKILLDKNKKIDFSKLKYEPEYPFKQFPVFDEPLINYVHTDYQPENEHLFFDQYRKTGTWPAEYYECKQQIESQQYLIKDLKTPVNSQGWEGAYYRILDPEGSKESILRFELAALRSILLGVQPAAFTGSKQKNLLQAIVRTSSSKDHVRMAREALQYFNQETAKLMGNDPSESVNQANFRPSVIDQQQGPDFLKMTDSEMMDQAMKAKQKGNMRTIVDQYLHGTVKKQTAFRMNTRQLRSCTNMSNSRRDYGVDQHHNVSSSPPKFGRNGSYSSFLKIGHEVEAKSVQRSNSVSEIHKFVDPRKAPVLQRRQSDDPISKPIKLTGEQLTKVCNKVNRKLRVNLNSSVKDRRDMITNVSLNQSPKPFIFINDNSNININHFDPYADSCRETQIRQIYTRDHSRNKLQSCLIKRSNSASVLKVQAQQWPSGKHLLTQRKEVEAIIKRNLLSRSKSRTSTNTEVIQESIQSRGTPISLNQQDKTLAESRERPESSLRLKTPKSCMKKKENRGIAEIMWPKSTIVKSKGRGNKIRIKKSVLQQLL